MSRSSLERIYRKQQQALAQTQTSARIQSSSSSYPPVNTSTNGTQPVYNVNYPPQGSYTHNYGAHPAPVPGVHNYGVVPATSGYNYGVVPAASGYNVGAAAMTAPGLSVPTPVPTPVSAPIPVPMMMPVPGHVALGQSVQPPVQPAAFAPIRLSGDDAEDNFRHDDLVADERSALPMVCNSSFNINSLLFSNISESEYFKALDKLGTVPDVLHEVRVRVTHVEPWQTGTSRVPSTAFCLLVKLMQLKLSRHQLAGMFEASEPLVRALGLLYLRYTCPPRQLWALMEPLAEDPEALGQAGAGSVGEFCVKLATEMAYAGTTLPRIPLPVERRIKVLLLLQDLRRQRRELNMRVFEDQPGRFATGERVRAVWGDDYNEPAWYWAQIDSLETEAGGDGGCPSEGTAAGGAQFWVTFPEYGDSCCVDIGDIMLAPDESSGGGRSRSRSRDREKSPVSGGRDEDRHRGRHDKRGHEETDELQAAYARLMSVSSGELRRRVLESARGASTAQGRDYGGRVTSYKQSLALQADRYTSRRRSRSRSPERKAVHLPAEGRDNGGDRRSGGEKEIGGQGRGGSGAPASTGGGEGSEQRRRLTAIYGDASVK